MSNRSDGSTASYYQLPEGCAELQDLISYRNMNGQIAEIFRACYRYGLASHSDQLRDAKKVLFYAAAEVDRLEKYERTPPVSERDEAEFPLVGFYSDTHTLTGVERVLNDATQQVQVVCLSGDSVSQRMSWQDVSALSAVHPVYIRSMGGWVHIQPTPIAGINDMQMGDEHFRVVGFIKP